MAKNDNAKTLQAYNQKVQAYVDDLPAEPIAEHKDFMKLALKGLDHSANILELGSGTGRDAKWIQSLGYKVLCTDAAESFLELLASEGLDSKLLDVLKDDFGGPYDLIYASALLVHFDDAETELIIRKAHAALKPNGRFAIRTKEGQRDGWTTEKMDLPRYMRYWDKATLESNLEKAGFRITSSYSTGGSKDHRGVPWMYIVAEKTKS